MGRSDGFVLVDAVVAVAIVAAAGTVIYTLGQDMLQEHDRRLDRSVAMLNLRALSQQLSVIGTTGQAGQIGEDELFTYAILPAPGDSAPGSLSAMTLEARPHRGGDVEAVEVLVPRVGP